MIAIMALVDPTFWTNFWPSFWADFAANFIVGIILTMVIAWLWDKRKNKVDARILFQLRSLDEPLAAEFRFVLKNTGNVAFRENEIYWHVFIGEATPSDDLLATDPEPHLIGQVLIDGKNFVHYSGLLPAPAFPGRQLQLFSTYAILRTTDPKFYYFLSTAHGYFPRDLEADEDGDPLLEGVLKKGRIAVTRKT
jgi:hypothetical protein